MSKADKVAEEQFFATVEKIDAPRHQERRVVAALKTLLGQMSAHELEDFHRGFDLALEKLRTPEHWSAASIIHEAIDPHAFDGFATWLLMQGAHVVRRVLREPDEVLTALTWQTSRRPRQPNFERLLLLPRKIYGERFDADIHDEVMPPKRRALLPLYGDSDNTDQIWTHPEVLEQRLPSLWHAFTRRDLRLFPWIDETDSVCACCGRVHRYGFGFLAKKGECIGSYTLHWIEGQLTGFDSMITLTQGDDPSISVATRQYQSGSNSGMGFLAKEDAPFEPQTAQLLDPEAARQHASATSIRESAYAVYLRDPRVFQFRFAWERRHHLSARYQRKIEQPPGDYCQPCATCGVVHENMEISHELPDVLMPLNGWQWRHRVQDEGDDIVLDGRRKFSRGLVPIEVADATEAYMFGAWVEHLDPSHGKEVLDGASKAQRLERGPRGFVANDFLFLPENSLGLDVSVCKRNPQQRPHFILESDSTHPLALLQQTGMAADMPNRLLTLTAHSE